MCSIGNTNEADGPQNRYASSDFIRKLAIQRACHDRFPIIPSAMISPWVNDHGMTEKPVSPLVPTRLQATTYIWFSIALAMSSVLQ